MSDPACAGNTASMVKSPCPPRTVIYYQTHQVNGRLVSMREAAEKAPGISVVVVGAVHLNDEVLTLNDLAPDDEHYGPMWADLAEYQATDRALVAMFGGAAKGSYAKLDGAAFNDADYQRLVEFLRRYHLDGIDLDIEEEMTLEGAVRLVKRLRADFGPDFIITMAPVDTALREGQNLSGFDYDALWARCGDEIDWLNVQFYCGTSRGTMDNTRAYDEIVARGVYPVSKLVAGTITHPMHGHGYVPIARLQAVYRELAHRYPGFGGAMAWEYFNSEPGGVAAPWEWARAISAALSEGTRND